MTLRPLTARGVLLLAAGVLFAVAANLVAAPILMYIAVLLLALPLLTMLLVLVPQKRLRARRRLTPPLVTVGTQAWMTLDLDSSARTRLRGEWQDTLPDGVSATADGTFSGAAVRYELTGEKRGVWEIGPWRLRVQDPFGLAQRRFTVKEPAPVVVAPELVPLSTAEWHPGGTGGGTHTASTLLGQGADNLSPRPYTYGDSMRRVHWRATAHRGQIMVRQEEEEPSPDALIVLDRSVGRWADDPEGFETAVSACASIALHLQETGFDVEVIDAAGAPLGLLSGTEYEREDLLRALAAVAPAGESLPLSALTNGTLRATLVFITGRVEEVQKHGGARHPFLLGTPAQPAVAEQLAAQRWIWAPLDEGVASAWLSVLGASR